MRLFFLYSVFCLVMAVGCCCCVSCRTSRTVAENTSVVIANSDSLHVDSLSSTVRLMYAHDTFTVYRYSKADSVFVPFVRTVRVRDSVFMAAETLRIYRVLQADSVSVSAYERHSTALAPGRCSRLSLSSAVYLFVFLVILNCIFGIIFFRKVK